MDKTPYPPALDPIKTSSVIVDAAPVFMDKSILSPCLFDIWNSDSLWNINSAYPKDLDETVQSDYEFDIQKLYEYLSLKLPNVNFGLLSYYGDTVIRSFYSFGLNDCTYPPTSSISNNNFKIVQFCIIYSLIVIFITQKRMPRTIRIKNLPIF